MECPCLRILFFSKKECRYVCFPLQYSTIIDRKIGLFLKVLGEFRKCHGVSKTVITYMGRVGDKESKREYKKTPTSLSLSV